MTKMACPFTVITEKVIVQLFSIVWHIRDFIQLLKTMSLNDYVEKECLQESISLAYHVWIFIMLTHLFEMYTSNLSS